MKEILSREDKLALQNSVLVALAGGTQEEIKVRDTTLFHDLLQQACFWFLVFQCCSKGLCE